MKTIKKIALRLVWMFVLASMVIAAAPAIALWGTEFVSGAWDYVIRKLN